MIRMVLLLLISIGIVEQSLAATYTFDKRKYVNAWSSEPYSYVLKMRPKTGGAPFCTANMVAGKIVTAKHCVVNKSLKEISFTSSDGRNLCAVSGTAGKFVDGQANTYNGDWAVLEPCSKDKEYVEAKSLSLFGEHIPISVVPSKVSYLGFGALKIMSDEEIKQFKQAYYSFVYDNAKDQPKKDKKTFVAEATSDRNSSVRLNSTTGQRFLQNMTKYGVASNILKDTNNLKESVCATNTDPNKTNLLNNLKCQSWGGDSGGGLYMIGFAKDVSGRVSKEARFVYFVGIHTRGSRQIGGTGHANKNTGQDVTVSNFSKYLD